VTAQLQAQQQEQARLQAGRAAKEVERAAKQSAQNTTDAKDVSAITVFDGFVSPLFDGLPLPASRYLYRVGKWEAEWL
jgi:hypothetical protein